MLSHSFFLLNKCDSLLGNAGKHVFVLTWLSTSWCLGHFALLGQYQKLILFLLSLLKNVLIADASRMNMFWRGSTLDSKIFLAAAMESVMTVMLWMSSISIVGTSPVRIAMSSASRGVIFIEWTFNDLMIWLLDQMCAIAVATWDFLIPPSAIIAVLLLLICDDLKVCSRPWRCWWRSSLEEEEREWKVILPEKRSTNLEPGEKREWRGLKHCLTPFKRSLTSLTGLLRLACYFMVSLEIEFLWGIWSFAC